MKPRELQVGESLVLPVNAKLVVRSMGVPTLFCMVFDGGFDKVDSLLGDKYVKCSALFYHLLGRLKPMSGNRVQVDIAALAARYSVSVSAVYRWLAVLRRADLIRKQTPKGWYAVNPYIAWSGHTTERAEALAAWNSGLVGSYMQADGENDAL